MKFREYLYSDGFMIGIMGAFPIAMILNNRWGVPLGFIVCPLLVYAIREGWLHLKTTVIVGGILALLLCAYSHGWIKPN